MIYLLTGAEICAIFGFMNKLGNQEQIEAHLETMVSYLNAEDQELYEELDCVCKKMSTKGVPYIVIHNFDRSKVANSFVAFNFLSDLSLRKEEITNQEKQHHIWKNISGLSGQILEFIGNLWHVSIVATSNVPAAKGQVVFSNKQ